jgi:hypothetical protein
MERQWHDRSPYVNQSLFNPEWVYGVSTLPKPQQTNNPTQPKPANPALLSLQMMSPTAPLANKQLIWHLYSAQAYGVRPPSSFSPSTT